MSTKTTFKRVALVAVAALGFGVLSVVPSSAAVINLTTTVENGTADTDASDSTTAGTLSVKFTSNDAQDSVTVTSYVSSKPATSGDLTTLKLAFADTATSTLNTTVKTTNGAAGALGSALTDGAIINGDSTTAVIPASGAAATNAASFLVYFDTYTGLKAGTYVITSVITPYNDGVAGTAVSKDLSIVVSATDAESTVASAAFSALGDPAATAVATVSSTNAATTTMSVTLKNASNQPAARESVTATITGPGTIGSGDVRGKSVVLAYGGSLTLSVWSDGTAGVATINVSTPSVTFAPKTITFYAKSPKTITAANYAPVLNVGENALTAAAVVATAVDANGTNWAGALYIKAVAAADALVGGSATAPVACYYSSDDKVHLCPVTAKTTGTAKYVVVDQSAALGTETAYAAAMSAATSNEVTVTVSAGVPTTVKLAFDKAAYQPFEKATITVTPLDADGKTIGTRTITSLFATGGITSNIAFGSQSDTLTAVTLTTAAATTSTKNAGAYTYTVYMPAQGDVIISATGGTGLAAAGQVKVTATAVSYTHLTLPTKRIV